MFTSEMENNKYLNFTSYIKADMKTFLIAVAGNISIFPFAAGMRCPWLSLSGVQGVFKNKDEGG